MGNPSAAKLEIALNRKYRELHASLAPGASTDALKRLKAAAATRLPATLVEL